jgi:putative acetyltransferase
VIHEGIAIRPERPADAAAIYTVNKEAFDGREAEAELVEAIRRSETFIPELSLVAEAHGRIAGHILLSRVLIQTENEQVPAIALAPMAVLPKYQNQGIGSALVRRGLEVCEELGHAIVIVLGHSGYYPRFGFSAQLAQALECPYGDCGEAWMAIELVPGALREVRGKVVYPPAFEGVQGENVSRR